MHTLIGQTLKLCRNCAEKYILIELSKLVDFDYGLSDTQD